MIVILKASILNSREVEYITRFRQANEYPSLYAVLINGKTAYLMTDEEIEAVSRDRKRRNNKSPVKVYGRGAKYIWSGGQQRPWEGAGDGEGFYEVWDVGFVPSEEEITYVVDKIRDNKVAVLAGMFAAIFILVVLSMLLK